MEHEEVTDASSERNRALAKMCFERLIHLKCGHYESSKIDSKGCKSQAGRKCPDYLQAIVGNEPKRSCPKCKALNLAALGIASPSLRRL